MTIRVRPVDRGRTSRDPNRRTFFMNLGFGIATVVAILILVIVGTTTWYGAHLASAATVDGQAITKDQFAERATVEAWRLQQQDSRIQAEVAAGRLTSAQASSRSTQIQNQLSQSTFIPAILEKLIDTKIQAKLAQEAGITITPAQIDQRILDEKTRKEERHAFMIAVKPAVDTGATTSTDAQKAAAKTAAQDGLAQIKSGAKTWDDVAKAISNDASKTTGGDIGWIDTTASEDANWQAAIFKLAANGVTDVIEGVDGVYRIGRVTEIAPAQVDPAWDQKLADAKVNPAAYRAAVESEAIRQALEDKVVADASQSGPQRHVDEIKIAAPQSTPLDKAVKVRHILYSPKSDPQGASALPSNDPSWATAQAAAQKAYDTIKADPKQFDAIARKESNETSAQGDDGSGGKLPYFDPTSQIDQAFADQIFKAGLKPGDLLPPFRSSFGWHVVQIMYYPPDADQMKKIKDQIVAGGDFAQLAKDNSDGSKAGLGGDIGWVAKGQLDDRLTAAIFAAPVGGLTDVIDIPSDGLYLFKVVEEKTAAPDATQLAAIKQSAFSNWYKSKKDAVKVTRELLGA
ncbi:MAG TPA: peptidylprolyl isomerase [Candidatus Limnocylindrales bacterium]|nr:peptidylprolyl isomerase [Candidatus Limnocylindrales bacterium]